MRRTAQRAGRALPCEPAGGSGFGLRSRRRSGCGPQGRSDHAGESDPWTCEGSDKREQHTK